MKKRTLTGLISGLICCSLVGVGFAAWVITGDATDSSTAGSITAEAITDNSVTIKSMTWGEGAANDAKICFGAPAKMTNESAWLTNVGGTSEDLTAVLTVTVGNYEKLDKNTITATLEEVDTTKIQTAVTGNLIVKKDLDIQTTGNGVFTIKVEFGWGTKFNSQNPYTYYNGFSDPNQKIGDTNVTYKEDAKTNIKALKDLNEVGFKLKVTAKAAA